MPAVGRILDANANRAREGLRVLEEAARFLWEDARLSAALKHLRHDLTTVLKTLPEPSAHRDVAGDVGVTLSTPTEQCRHSVAEVVLASCGRLGEALRVLEEYGKLLPLDGAVSFAARIEAVRYRFYQVEEALLAALRGGRAQQWRLCLLLTEALCTHHPWDRVLAEAVAGGVDCVQVREKQWDAGPLLERVRQVVAFCRPRGVTVIVNDRPDVALAGGADGVHLGQGDLPVRAVRQGFGGQLLVGVSTGDLAEAQRARADGADYCGVGPMFPTTTKHKPVLAGPAYLRTFRAWNGLPHLAIGGIQPENLPQLVAEGVEGIAVSSAICAAREPRAVAVAFRAGLAARPAGG